MTDPDTEPIPLYVRIGRGPHTAATATARRLGISMSQFVEDALNRSVTSRADEVSAADERYKAEVGRLVVLSQSRDIKGGR